MSFLWIFYICLVRVSITLHKNDLVYVEDVGLFLSDLDILESFHLVGSNRDSLYSLALYSGLSVSSNPPDTLQSMIGLCPLGAWPPIS